MRAALWIGFIAGIAALIAAIYAIGRGDQRQADELRNLRDTIQSQEEIQDATRDLPNTDDDAIDWLRGFSTQ